MPDSAGAPDASSSAGDGPRRPTVVLGLMSSVSSLKQIISDSLPDELHEPIRRAGAAWRDPRKAAARLEALRRAHNLPGLVVWYAHEKKPPTLPAPIDVPFEPLELDESRSPLVELVAVADPDEATRRSHAVRRWMTRIGLPLIVLAPQFVNGAVQVLLNPSTFIIVLWVVILTLLVGMFVLMWWLADQWLIVPGGIVVRRALFGRVGERLRLYTPGDSVLIVRPSPPGYQIELWHEGRSRHRKVTELEAAAAIGAWQSRLAAPSRARLSDLLQSMGEEA